MTPEWRARRTARVVVLVLLCVAVAVLFVSAAQ